MDIESLNLSIFGLFQNLRRRQRQPSGLSPFGSGSTRRCGCIGTTFCSAEAAAEPDPERRLSALLERWKRDTRPGTKQADAETRHVRLFISRFGDLPAERVTPLPVSQFKDALLQVARNASALLHGASLDALAAWSLKPEDLEGRRLSRPTTDAKASGGQRVALARAMVRRPGTFPTDEPLSNLDIDLRVRARGEIVETHRRAGVPRPTSTTSASRC